MLLYQRQVIGIEREREFSFAMYFFFGFCMNSRDVLVLDVATIYSQE